MNDATIEADPSEGGEWYRSPIALVGGLVLFVAALALIVLAISGGDDAADDAPTSVATTETAADAAPAAESQPAAPPISFGGDTIPEVDAVTVEGDVLPPLGGDEIDPAIGTAAPVITATSLGNGNPITLSPGRARVIGFFAHWCPHCQAEIPELVEWLGQNGLPPNTEVIAVSTVVDEGRGNYPPSAWFTAEGWSTPVLVDDANATLLNAYGFGGFPAFIAIDANGVVVARAGGNIGAEGFAALFDNFAS